MKIKFLITGLLGLITVAAFAQKGDQKPAQEEYTKYVTLKSNKSTGGLALTSLKNAKEAVDKASANAKTSSDPLTYALKAAIYGSLAFNDTTAATSLPLFATGEEAYRKAKELDTKGENKKLLDDAALALSNYKLNQGVKEYGAKKYDLAYKSFDYSRQMMNDTTSTYYAGLAAAQASMWDPAIENFNRLLNMDYKRKQSLYMDLSNFYLDKKDTVNAIKVVTEASAKYPKDPSFSKRMIEMNLQTGKKAEVLSKIESAIANDPTNKSLYYYAGITYTSLADDAANKLKKEKDPATIATLTKTRDDYYSKSIAVYKKALEIDPNYFEANLNLGYVMIQPAIDLFNAANKMPVNKQKEYDAAIAQANTLFDAAKPYLQKAVDLQPKSTDALFNLKTYYLGKKDMVHANELKKQIDALNGATTAPSK